MFYYFCVFQDPTIYILIWLQRTSYTNRRLPAILHKPRALLRIHVVNEGVVWSADHDNDPMVGTDGNKDKRRLLRGWSVQFDAGWQSSMCFSGAHGYDCESPGLGWLDDPLWMNVSG